MSNGQHGPPLPRSVFRRLLLNPINIVGFSRQPEFALCEQEGSWT